MDEPRSLIARSLAIAGMALGGLLLIALILLCTLDLSPLMRPFEGGIGKAIGRQVSLSGEAHAVLLPRPALRFQKVFVANRVGGTRPDLLLADQVEARIGLSDWLHPHITVYAITIRNAVLTLEQTPSGPSWLLSHGHEGPHEVRALGLTVEVEPRRLTIDNLKIAARFPWQAETSDYAVDQMLIERPANGPHRLLLLGRSYGDPWHASATLSPIDSLLNDGSFALEGNFDGLGAQIAVHGNASLATNKETELTGSATVSDTLRLFGLRHLDAVTATPAQVVFTLKSNAQNESTTFVFDKLGAGDLRIDLSFQRKPAALSGSIDSSILDLRAIPPLLPSAPTDGKLLSSRPLRMPFLKNTQLDLKWRAKSIIWNETQIGHLDVGLWANHGIVAVGPLRLEGPHADISGDVALDLRMRPRLSMSVKASVQDSRVWLGDPVTNGTNLSRGDIALELDGTGDSMAEIFASGYGQANLLLGPGLSGPGIAAHLPDFIASGVDEGKVQALPLAFSCVISRFDLINVQAVSRAFMVESEAAMTTGQGTIDFSNQTIDFRLAPRPKDPDRISDAKDIKVSGPVMRSSYEAIDGDAARGLSRLAGQAALTDGVEVLMPLLGSERALGNSCVRSLLGIAAPKTEQASIVDASP